MEDKLATIPGLFERLAASSRGLLSRSTTFGRRVFQASRVEVYVLEGEQLQLIESAGRARLKGGSATELLPELRGERGVLFRPADAGERARPLLGAHVPIRLFDGSLAGCYSVFYSARRGRLGAVERRTMREIVAFLAQQIEAVRRIELVQRSTARADVSFEGIAQSSPDAIVAADAHNIILAWNVGAERLFGYTAEEAVGRSLDLIIPPAMRQGHRAGMKRVADDGPTRLIGRAIDLQALRKDGSSVPVELSLSQWMEGSQRRFGAIMRDISERQRLEENLRVAAMLDHLTGLSNRACLDHRLEQVLRSGRRATALLVDLDGFKDVNDTLGHQAGDLVLAEVARRLRSNVHAAHFIARLGGDEFVVLLEDTANPLEGDWLGETLINAIEETIPADGNLVSISASVGIACSYDGCTAETLLGDADLALYKAKRDGRGRTQLFTPDLRHRLVEKGLARTELTTAWAQDQFELYYQPQLFLEDARVCGAEALLRWNHPSRGVISPAAFLPLLETDTLAVSVGDWIIGEACRQAAEWRRTAFPDIRVAVNLFALQFKSGDIVGEVARALERNGLSPDGLEIEITENTILQTDERILRQLKRLRDLGVGLAFDDFGTGYASLSMLRHYPVTKIKIDRSFVSGRDVSDKDQAITRALVQMAEGLGITVTAEGIETPAQHALMRDQGCHVGQGYLYSRPVPAAMFQALPLEAMSGWRVAG
ncbi:bifunctional diguanylate cyclase/phosphodiesterase [Aureimonas sp. SK2]|uniref:putative bifunctional diguanylate cyclase/phosphodiesterase n=1 Tax=Aureimonas sp. SK2 TaxID=3015992 RepID=UPI00244376F1|nr:GGDEF domain-containing phosphodiesterase [Aureimonas sp. SK2]